MERVSGDIGSGLIDLSEVDLDAIDAIDSPILAATLKQIHDEVEHPEEAVAGFNSSL